MNIGNLNGLQLNNLELRESKKHNEIEVQEDRWTKQLDKARDHEITQPENDYSEKKPSDITTKKKLSPKQSLVEDILRKQPEMESKTELEIIQEDILAMLMKYLQIPEAKIQNTLEKMGKQLEDLVSQEGLKDFIMTHFDVTEEDLLSGTVGIKDIGKLFQELEMIQDKLSKMSVEHGQDVGILELIQHNQAADNSLDTDNEVLTQHLTQVDGTQDMKKQIIERTVKNESSETQGVMDLINNVELGLDLPIEMPLGTQKNLWQTQGEFELSGLYVQKQQPIVLQMIEKLDLSALRESNEITMELTPRSLGKLSIKIAENQGIITAHIKVENERVKEALLQDLTVLAEKLEVQGLKVGAFQVDVREHGEHSAMEKQKQKSSKRIQEIMNKQIEQLDKEEAIAVEVDSDNAINLMA